VAVVAAARADTGHHRDRQLQIRQDRVGHQVRPTDRGDPQLGIGQRPQWVIDLGDDLLDPEGLGRQLGGHDVPVVALGHRQEQVGILGAGTSEGVLVGSVTADRVALERAREAVEGSRGDVEDRDLMAAVVEHHGEHRAHPTASDDHCSHAVQPRGVSLIGSRTTHTAHGAFENT
jgi:hypothetical protein